MAQSPEQGAAPASRTTNPQFFYLASYDGYGWMIIDIEPASAWDAKVRFIQAYPVCGTYHVQEDDYVFENVSVGELAGSADICLPAETLARLMNPFKRKQKDTTASVNQGIEAQCDTEKVVHSLPASQSLRFKMLKEKAPRIAALWTLAQEIMQRYTESGHHLVIPTPYVRDPDRMQKRYLSEQAAIEIRNGNYDLVLPELPESLRFNGQTRLSQVIPGPEEATGPEEDFGIVENVEQLRRSEAQAIPYPQMARIAHVQGDVRLKVYVDAKTGAVLNVVALSGHPILAQGASEGISKWKFLLPYSGENPLTVVVHYKLQCLSTIETTTNTTKAQKHPTKKARKK